MGKIHWEVAGMFLTQRPTELNNGETILDGSHDMALHG